jgi:hypothetical protein
MKKVLIPLVTGSLLLGSVMMSSAGTFAQFIEQTGGNAFSFTGGNAGTLSTTNTLVFFQFKSTGGIATLQPTPFDVNISGRLTFSAVANGTPATAGSNPSQQFGTTGFTFTSAANQGVGGVFIPAGTNLLTGTVTPSGLPLVAGTLSGPNGGSSATYSGSDVNPPPGFANDVTFSSAYLDFTGSFNDAYAYSFSSVSPSYTLGGAFPFQFINPFTAAGTGTFSSDVVPEPGLMALMAGMGVFGSLLAFRRVRLR